MTTQLQPEVVQSRDTENSRILVVEDEPQVSSFLCQTLVETGYRVFAASNLADALPLWLKHRPSAVVLDLMLPDGDGLSLIKSARDAGEFAPVLILSAKASMPERIEGLDAGADDYLAKPFGIQELIARLKVLLRRNRPSADGLIQCGDLVIDLTSHRVTRAGRMLFLSETEYRLLNFLAHQLGNVVTKSAILAHVWDDRERDENVVEVYISYLRTKLERNRASRLIHTVRGQGYVLAEHPIAQTAS